jgi:protein-L-isoaspartate(D-aspartate) O-methyltransferase
MGEQSYWQEKIAVTLLAVLWVPLACAAGSENYEALREQMVQRQIIARGVQDPRVLEAMRSVPRHLFVPKRYRASSYEDHPLPIGKGQTISQPYIVAYMTEALELTPDDRVLEIGTGSGYQAAVLAELVREVYSVEIIESLGNQAEKQLKERGYDNIWVKIGDGYKGWPEKAPFDAVIVTCAPEHVPQALVDQLREGGRLIIPVGGARGVQKLVRAVKYKGALKTDELLPVRFVPMVKGNE